MATWRRLATLGSGASAALLIPFWVNPFGVVGLLIDGTILGALARSPGPEAERKAEERPSGDGRPGRESARGDHKPVFVRMAEVTAIAFAAWMGLVSLSAPWHRFWGSTAPELAEALPGDLPLPGPPTYMIQHAVTIAAAPGEAWPWLAQLGTDKGGFYSYSFLERAFGIDVQNADRIHEEWQHVGHDGFVLAAPAGYLGFDHPLGWDLERVEPERLMVLENWGAFVLLPAGEGRTRFIVRTRNGQPPSVMGLTMAWAGLAFFEPVHFVMERRMLLGIKERAEAAHRWK